MNTNNSIVTPNDVIGVDVKNLQKEDLGKIENIILDKFSGQARYVVLSFGGFIGIGEKLFAVPWKAIRYDENEDCFILNRSKESLKQAPGFDKDHLPAASDPQWQSVDVYYHEDHQ